MSAKAVLVMIIVLALICAGGFYAGQKYKLVPAETPVVTIPTTESTPKVVPIGTTMPVLTPSPTVDETAAILTAVKAGLVAEHGPNASSMNVTVSKIQGNHAQGGAIDPGSVGGAMWLATKVGGTWKLVWDGNGTISCASIDPYNFPVSMVPECWNETTGKSVTR